MKRLLFLFSFAILALTAMANEEQQQDQRHRFNPTEFVAKMEAYITQRAGFTKEEAEKFYPIFHEMKGKQRDLNRKAQWLKRQAPQGDDKAYAETIQKITEMEIQVAKLSDHYYKKMCKAVPAQKVWKAMQADDAFTRDMLNAFNRGREQWNREHGKDRGKPNPNRK